MQTILGSGGAVGIPLARNLKTYTDRIRLVSRNPVQVNGDDELYAADLTQANQVDAAVAGSEVVYLTVGLKYDTNTWQKHWPVVMANVINACIKHGARLVFLDNIYMYAESEIPHMKETSACKPSSKKGQVRADLQTMLFEAIKERGLKALIARSADFYGPSVKNSPLAVMVFDQYGKEKKAFWQIDANKFHAFTYVPDAAQAVALLGNTSDVFGEIWHLPTSAERLTGKQFIEKIALEMHLEPRFYIFSRLMMSLIGLFVPIVKELREMAYQYDRDYVFDSSKFEERFSFSPIGYTEGIKHMINSQH
ncbi:NAD-dependent epimerase/dehydratase family protein [Dyadobacter sp. LHD-138]|uniref:NAD-dependent epimerase/dehydratase family protein n=1 Tax=Dyadobacter sp. LHD-138 TaxID=3071413 RepID=UPI0027DF10AD|nr:NAD-dependent epimerase/dehydratase family protein [Dyadobacter sp. LHD-138]MDQ6482024.1 NAD-dependent epimerase/dehydratase family protein [Dyadobacter sp. LHD-138]